ncbi:acyltransferase family protein [Paenibacillus wulumuqiensis]|uniref:acyltransferase family protein n=1 Tax=Paenibacillus wulumuqiensis TaxID=1567107 RepID=UPI0006193382|nr:acyltransferase family protein [Paenibacillus wulumuqiensis]
MTKRDAYFDNVKFLLILLVVIGHLIEPLYDDPLLRPLYLLIYSFHIPMFVLISGYFAKNIGTGDYLNKVISRLVIPYLVFETLYSLFDYWIYDRAELVFSYFTPYWLMWFFFSMILWKVAMPYIIRIRYALPIAIGIALLAGYANDAQYYASVSRTIVFFPFLLAGYYLDKSVISRLHSRGARLLSVVVLGGSFAMICLYSQLYRKEWFYGSFSYETLGHNEWSAGIYRIGVYALAVLVGGAVLSLVPRRTIPVISGMGMNTLYTYLLHGFLIMALTAGGLYDILDSTASKLLLIPLGLVITVILSLGSIRTWLRWLVEPRARRMFKRNPGRAGREGQTEHG